MLLASWPSVSFPASFLCLNWYPRPWTCFCSYHVDPGNFPAPLSFEALPQVQTDGTQGYASLSSFPEDHSPACCPCCISLDWILPLLSPLGLTSYGLQSWETRHLPGTAPLLPPGNYPPPPTPAGLRCFQGTFTTLGDLVSCWRWLFQPQMVICRSLCPYSRLIYLIFQS